MTSGKPKIESQTFAHALVRYSKTNRKLDFLLDEEGNIMWFKNQIAAINWLGEKRLVYGDLREFRNVYTLNKQTYNTKHIHLNFLTKYPGSIVSPLHNNYIFDFLYSIDFELIPKNKDLKVAAPAVDFFFKKATEAKSAMEQVSIFKKIETGKLCSCFSCGQTLLLPDQVHMTDMQKYIVENADDNGFYCTHCAVARTIVILKVINKEKNYNLNSAIFKLENVMHSDDILAMSKVLAEVINVFAVKERAHLKDGDVPLKTSDSSQHKPFIPVNVPSIVKDNNTVTPWLN